MKVLMTFYRRWRCGRFGLPINLVWVTIVCYGVLLALYQPLTQLDLVPHPAVAETPSPRTRQLPTVELDVQPRSFCDGHFVAYGRQFAHLTLVVIDRRHCRAHRSGGESMDAVINQPESVEYYRFDRGCFRLKCPAELSTVAAGRVDYMFVDKRNHLNLWLQSLETTKVDAVSANRRQRFTVAVTRYEYANLYHTMTDWYNTFLLLCFLNKTADDTDVLFVDAHPRGALDAVWRRLFHRTLRLSDLPADRPTLFDQLAWGWLGYNTPMTIRIAAPTPPLIDEFRNFFLSAYGLPSQAARPGRPDCTNQGFSVLFIWRRDYVAHPRNPLGSVTRKIANEDELLRRVASLLPRSNVSGVQIDLYSMDQQLCMIINTDILIGMLGAGLTHALFLPASSALIELIPTYWSPTEHFAAIAAWRRIVYLRWINSDLKAELLDRSTVVPPSVIASLVRTAVRRICPPESSARPDELELVPA